MRIVFVSNIFNHYQVTLSDALYELCNQQFYFVETSQVPEDRKKGGFDILQRPYLLRTWEGANIEKKAHALCQEADVLICTSELFSIPYKRERLKKEKLTFEYSERLLKKGIVNAFSKTNIINHIYYHLLFRNKPFYKLCAGAYVANDEYLFHSFIGKCFKFGYFPKVKELDIDEVLRNKNKGKIQIIWCARFINWKHPEMVVDLAKKIKESKLNADINMIGDGVLFEKTQKSIVENNVSDVIHLIGNVPNNKVLEMMLSHHVFLLTSDKQEGWGVVVNEAMANGCCVVSSDAVGSVPYLIQDRLNGMLFKSENVDDLFNCIKEVVSNNELRENISRLAYNTISEEWSPERAAGNLFELCDSLLNKRTCSIIEGPCSKSLPFSR